MNLIPRTEIERLPFITKVPSDGRRVVLESYFDASAGDWHLYLEVESGVLGRIAGGEPVYGGYLSTEAADAARDLELPFATLIIQHLSFPKVQGRLQAIENDFHQCAAILEKYHQIWSLRAKPGMHTSLLVASELEYLLLLLRSMYDLLQGVVAEISSLLITLDDTHSRVTKQLPQSFGDVVMKGSELMSGDEIVEKYRLPAALANWYVGEAAAFRELRRLRDGIAHHGRTVPTIFELQEGLALDATDPVWSEFVVWPEEQRVRGKFGSVRALFAALILNSVLATTRFADVLRQTVKLPHAIGTNVKSYIRSPFGHRLVDLPQTLSSPWEGDVPPLAIRNGMAQ